MFGFGNICYVGMAFDITTIIMVKRFKKALER
jgi:hypothetical protein